MLARVQCHGVGEPAVADEEERAGHAAAGAVQAGEPLDEAERDGRLPPRRQQHRRGENRGRREQEQAARRGHGCVLPVQRHQAHARPPRSAAAALSATSHQSKTRPGVTSCTSSSRKPTPAAAMPLPIAAPIAAADRPRREDREQAVLRQVDAADRRGGEQAPGGPGGQPEGDEREVRPREGRAGAQEAADAERAGEREHDAADGDDRGFRPEAGVRPLHESRGVGQGEEDARRVQDEDGPARASHARDDTRGRGR